MSITLFLLKKKNAIVQAVDKVNIFCDGDSLTYGTGATISYPTALLGKLIQTDKFVTNTGVGGQTSEDLLLNYQTHLDAIYSVGYQNIAIIQIGVNDIYGNVAPNTIMSNIQSAVNLAISKGFIPCVNTTTPFYTGGNNQTNFDSWYAAGLTLNNLIRTNESSGNYNLIDIASNSEFNYQNAVYNTIYYTSDLVHLTNSGYDLIAQIVFNRLTNLNLI